MFRRISSLALFALCLLGGCSDPTRPHREELAIGMIQSTAWLHPDIDSFDPEMQQMHLGAGRAAFTADMLEKYLATTRPLDPDLISMLSEYAKLSRTLESQFQTAIDDGRPELNGSESKIASSCASREFFLTAELFERIDFNSLVTVSH